MTTCTKLYYSVQSSVNVMDASCCVHSNVTVRGPLLVMPVLPDTVAYIAYVSYITIL